MVDYIDGKRGNKNDPDIWEFRIVKCRKPGCPNLFKAKVLKSDKNPRAICFNCYMDNGHAPKERGDR